MRGREYLLSFPRAEHVWFDDNPPGARGSQSRIRSSQSELSQKIVAVLNKQQPTEKNMGWSRPAQGRNNSRDKILRSAKNGERGRWWWGRGGGGGVGGRRGGGREGWNQLYYKFKPIIRL